MSNVIIGMASGYSWRELEPFVLSLRKAYDGRCVLILGDGPHDIPDVICKRPSTADLRKKLEEYRIEAFDLGTFTEHPGLLRYKVVADILAQSNDIQFALTCDTKDVFVQIDPFVWIEQHLGQRDVCAVEEGVTYANSWGNRNNCLVAFGQEALTKLWELRVLNGGVIGGRADAVHHLCRAIHELCQQDRRLASFTPGYKDMLPDQSALNILMRGRYKDQALAISAQEGFCYLGNQGDVRVADGLVYRPGSQVPYSIVHQFFRHEDVVALLNEKYREAE